MPFFITGVEYDRHTGELIVTSQEFQAVNNAIVATRGAQHARIALNVPGVKYQVGAFTDMHLGGPNIKVEVTNTGLVPIYNAEMKLTVQVGPKMTQNVQFQPGTEYSPAFLPGETRWYWTDLDQKNPLLGLSTRDAIRQVEPQHLRVALLVNGEPVGQIDNKWLKDFFAE